MSTDPLLGLFNATQLAANLVVSDELDENLAVGARFKVAGEFQCAGALDEQVACIEARCAEFQHVLCGLGEPLFVGRFGCRRQVGKAHRPTEAASRQQGRAHPVSSCNSEQIPPRNIVQII